MVEHCELYTLGLLALYVAYINSQSYCTAADLLQCHFMGSDDAIITVRLYYTSDYCS